MSNFEKIYRLGYDNVFLSHPEVKVGNDLIGSLSIYIQYRLFSTKKIYEHLEICFESYEEELEKLEDQAIGKGIRYIGDEQAILGDYYLSDFLRCSFDKNYEGYIRLEEINKEQLEEWNYRIEYEIVEYTKDIVDETGCCLAPKTISKEEFLKIISENISNFDNSDNNINAQTCAYKAYPIEEGK